MYSSITIINILHRITKVLFLSSENIDNVELTGLVETFDKEEKRY